MRLTRLLAVGLLTWTGLLNWKSEVVAAPVAVSPQITALPDGLAIEWRASLPELIPHADGTLSVTMPGFAQREQPGQPRVPFASVLVALPPGSQATLVIEARDENALPLSGRLALAPRSAGVRLGPEGEIAGGLFEPAAPADDERLEALQLEPVGIVRGVLLARLTFYPARPAGPELLVTTEVQATLHFNAPGPSAASGADGSDPLLEAVKASVINPGDVQPDDSAPAEPSLSTQAAAVRAAVEVSRPGITAIDYAALAQNDFPVGSVNPANLHLTRAGVEIATEWDGDGDASFEPGEHLLFYADPRFSRYSNTDVYFLSAEGTPGLRMASRSASPGGLAAGNAWIERVFESNVYYTPECYCAPLPPGRDGDRWTWDVLRRPDRASTVYTFTLPIVDPAQPAQLMVWLIGSTDPPAVPDHRVSVAVNGATLGASEWDGKQAMTITLTIPVALLHAGDNTLGLTLPGLPGVSVEGAWLDAFSVRYARGSAAGSAAETFTGDAAQRAYTLQLSSTTGLHAYDISDPAHPQPLTGLASAANSVTLGDPAGGLPRRYTLAATGGILTPDRVRLAQALQSVAGANEVMIAPAGFIPALAGLVALRQNQGLSVVVEDVQAIYDAFDGRPAPDAIRAYLASAYAAWSPRPTFVLLVGDGTADPRRYRNDSTATLIPPYLADVDPWAGETAADNRYVTVAGGDALPDMLIGRLPVNSLSEAQTVVGKIVAYETAPMQFPWNANVVFVSDRTDSAGDFPAQSQSLGASYVAAPFGPRLVTVSTPISLTQQAVRGWWNAGAGLMIYNGHASIHQWSVERAFHLDDVSQLTNNGRLPIVLELTCFTGSFHTPGLPTLDEALVRQPGGGAVAILGPTGLGVSTGHQTLAAGFLQQMFAPAPSPLGQAVLAGKLKLAAQEPAAADLLDTFTLLGDPATRPDLTITPGFDVFMPVIQR